MFYKKPHKSQIIRRIKMTLSDLFRKIRHELCLSQAELSRAIDVTPSSMCLYEKGLRKISYKTIRKVMKFVDEKGIKITYQDFINSMDEIDDEQTKKTG
jgi:predicted transcriptional regulator